MVGRGAESLSHFVPLRPISVSSLTVYRYRLYFIIFFIFTFCDIYFET